ncbi:hypothetical protein OROHE_007577 [Orobanche hederae]
MHVCRYHASLLENESLAIGSCADEERAFWKYHN